MKNKILIITFLLPLFVKAQVTVDWSYIVGDVGIATDNSNNVYTARYDYNPAGDIYVTKRNSAGVQQWLVSYNQTDNSKWEKATWVECDMNGNAIVSGSLMSGYSNPVNAASILMKFSPSGTLLWRVVYETSFDGSYTKKCLVDKANNIYVLGLGTGPLGFVTKVKKFDANGNALWSYFDNLGIGAALNFKFTPDSNIVIAAKSITGSYMGYAKISRSGINIWNLAGIQSLTAGDLAGDVAGNTYIVHGNYGGTGSTIKKLGTNGALIWSSNYTNITAYRIEVGSDNIPVVCGYPIPGSGGSAFLKADANGTQVWYNNNADSIYNFLSHALVKMDQYNNIYLAAGIMTNMGMCKVNSSGTNAWAITFGTGYSQAFTIGTDYNVYVTGGATARLLQSPPITVCNVPSSLSVTNITAASATLNWNTVSGAAGYNVQYRKTGTATWITATSTVNSVNISSLSPSSVYEWQVQTNCGSSNLSAFSSVATFTTTAPPCNAPTGLSTTNILASSAKLNWSLVSNIIRYNVYYKKVSETTWTKKNVASTKNYLSITGLSCNTDYQWKIRTVCDTVGPDIISAFSPVQNFHTAACLNSDDLRFESMADESKTILVFPNPASDVITVVLSDADFDNAECSIFNSDGRCVLQKQIGTGTENNLIQLDVSQLRSGMYFLQVRNEKENQGRIFLKE